VLKKYLEYITYPAVMFGTYLLYMGISFVGVPQIVGVYACLIFAITAILAVEYYNPYREPWMPNLGDFKQDLVYLVFVQVLMTLGIRFGMIALLFGYGYQEGNVFDVWPNQWPVFVQVITIIVIGEFFQYWWHRLSHQIPLLWGIHSVHHYPKVLYSINTARFHPCDKFVEYFIDVFLFIALGADISVIYLYYIYFSVNGLFQHSNMKISMGPFNYVLATAQLHRLHHDIDSTRAKHNFGNNTIIWDVIFGTYLNPNSEVDDIGIDDPIEPRTVKAQMLHPFGKILKKYLMRILMLVKYKPYWKKYITQTTSPNEQQKTLLKSILHKNCNTSFGVEKSFVNISSYEEYKKALSVNEYEYFRPWINRIIKGEKNVLTQDEVDYFVTTSGTTGLSKYIPMTQKLEKDLKEMQNVLIYSLYLNREECFAGELFTVVGSAVEERVGDRFDCGSMSGKLYAKTSKLITKFQAVPVQIYELENYELKYLLLSTVAVLSRNTTLFTTANPSTLIKINDLINDRRADIIKMIENWDFHLFCKNEIDKAVVGTICWERYKEQQVQTLDILKSEGTLFLYDYWPNLQSIVTWTKGSCEYLISTLKSIAPKNTSIVELGYLSSEFRGTVNVNGEDSRSLATLAYNFFEFIPVKKYEDGEYDPILIGDLTLGEKYYIIVTTEAGLYRYFINDIVIATKGVGNTPCIEFIQKGKGVTNITGEKLTESQILSYFSVNGVQAKFFICLANPKDMEYRLYYEGDIEDFSASLHEFLCRVNVEYQAKTASGRLKKIKTIRLKDKTGEMFKITQVANGQRDSQLKHMHLDYLENMSFTFEAYKR
jgi:sterol desaturase/sphingolipid hydroxylase (fatty acid hydroxylase superfamily)